MTQRQASAKGVVVQMQGGSQEVGTRTAAHKLSCETCQSFTPVPSTGGTGIW